MEIAILVFFLAIFGGALFLAALIWFLFRRFRKPRSSNRNFSSGSNDGNIYVSSVDNDNFTGLNAGSAGIYSDNSTFENQRNESSASAETAHDSPQTGGNVHSHTSHSEHSAAPADSSYSDSSSSGGDSGSDSGSSSSDGGGSSSSSSD